MARDPRYDVLFEPVKIGPVTAKIRFYHVSHCTGMGWLRPNTLAAMRGVKAEGDRDVVNTEYCSIHPTLSVVFDLLASAVLALQTTTGAGMEFLFGYLAGGPTPFTVTDPDKEFVLAPQALPIIIMMSVSGPVRS